MGSIWAELADKSHTERQISFLKNHLKRGGVVLDVACGTGRHLTTLSEAGFDMVGLDASANLLRIAKQRQPSAQLVRGDMRFLPFKTDAATAAISMDTSLGYLPQEKDDQQSLADLHRVLGRGAVLVLDVFNPEHLSLKYGHRGLLKRLKWAALPLMLKLHSRWLLFRVFKWREYPSFCLLQKRTVSHSDDLLCDLWVVWEKSTGKLAYFEHRVRLYDKSKLQALLGSVGFAVEEVYGDYDEQRFAAYSPRLIFKSKS
ncbi:MAG: class I SAM-dependent methyltransferase [Candidatus Bathyarchaeota archaeon]|nr:class I SAM-dependent methyltransferase [Candidatus Bathyarchaeota archaeon]